LQFQWWSRAAGSTSGSGSIWGNIMKLVSEKLPNLHALYVKELRRLLSAEETIAIKEPIIAELAEDPELNDAIRRNVADTHAHASRLREILLRATGEADPLKCRVVYALFDEVEDLSQDAGHLQVRDAALLAEAQRVEHYQIAAYDALRQFARILGRDEDERVLEQTFGEEVLANEDLARIAERVYSSAQPQATAGASPATFSAGSQI
jgi:ferritin-like metal-binding protein YciE